VLIDPLSNIPVLLVTVCSTASLFVQVIEVPAETVMVEELNAIPSIKTSFAPAPLEDFLQLFVMLKIAPISNILTINLLLGNVFFPNR
jgi:hypothetical protein